MVDLGLNHASCFPFLHSLFTPSVTVKEITSERKESKKNFKMKQKLKKNSSQHREAKCKLGLNTNSKVTFVHVFSTKVEDPNEGIFIFTAKLNTLVREKV
jgi:hypothetical protein